MAMYSLIETSRRHIRPMRQLPDAGAQDRAQYRIEPRQRPFLDQGGRDVGIEPLLIGGHPVHDFAKKRRVGLGQLIAVDLLVEAIAGEFAHHRFGIEFGVQLELIERLHRRQPGYGAPPSANARASLAGGVVVCGVHPPACARRRFSSTIARQARTAAPPWSRPSGGARSSAWASFSQVRMP